MVGIFAQNAAAEAAAVPAVSLDVILSALAPLFDQGLDPGEARRRVGAAARMAGGDEQPVRRGEARLRSHISPAPSRSTTTASTTSPTSEEYGRT